MAVMMVRISSLERILSMRAFCTLRILPRSGRIAWKPRSRPCFAEPPAESPSTRYTSQIVGSSSEQSASFPGSNPPSRPLLLRTSSRALRAASRARAALTALLITARATLGFLSKNSASASFTTLFTMPSISELPVLDLDVEDAVQPFAHVVAGEGELFLLQEAVLLGPLVDGARQGGLEAGEVRAA